MNVAIVGAGLLGRTLALILHNTLPQQAVISLFDKGQLSDSEQTAKIAAAMIAPTAEATHSPCLICDMGEQSVNLWPKLLSVLGCHSKHFHQRGSLVVAFPQDLAELHHFNNQIPDEKKDRLRAVSSVDIESLEPELTRRIAGGYFIEGEAHLDNDAFLNEVDSKLKASHVHIRENTITSPSELLNRADESFDLVIDCRGVGAKTEHNLKTLRGVRGEVIRVYAPEVNLARPIRLMHPKYALYVVPKPNHRFVIGATEIESESDSPITVRSTLELLSAAFSIHSGFSEAQIEQASVGLRPAMPDHLPIVKERDRLIQINGLYRHGYLLLPSLIKQVWPIIGERLSLNLPCVFEEPSDLHMPLTPAISPTLSKNKINL